jgi:adenine-specific DNA-methyltransferase
LWSDLRAGARVTFGIQDDMAKKRTTKQESKASRRAIEQYAHKGKSRPNNPPVGLVTSATDPPEPKRKKYAYDPHLDPQLVWAGKAERTSFEVPTVSLHVHERIDPKTIIRVVRSNGNGKAKGKPRQRSLFEEPEENPPLRDALDFYKHKHGWTNRLIAGDSLLVMNSLLEKEGMAGKVQMIYIDPPYGIRYGSNFQPFLNRRDVVDGKDDDLTQEPEMLSAFRDTWELGVHSYLTCLHDRLKLARDLLHESGSIFAQISDENLHLVRNLLDEVFGPRNLVVIIPVKKKGSQKSELIDPVNDYLIWYTKTPRAAAGAAGIKYHQLFRKRDLDLDTLSEFRLVEGPDGREFTIDSVETDDGRTVDYRLAPPQLFRDLRGARLFRWNPLTSGGHRANQSLPFKFEGRIYPPKAGACWKTTVRTDDGSVPGMTRLAWANRLGAGRETLNFKRYLEDFGYVPLSNWWDGLGGASNPVYVVQTNPEIVQRCVLMTTDPGDLVFDPTCGSGTTAYVAEQWGRRWITCDTSRVAITLAKQRMLTTDFAYYALARPDEGVGSGFVYKTVPHITLGSIANNPDIRERMNREQIEAVIKKHAQQETLYDQPENDRTKARVTGPFTVEAVPAVTVRPIDETGLPATDDLSVARSGPTSRQDEWRDELAKTGVRGKSGQKMEFARLEPLAAARYLHALGETNERKPKAVAVSFGPEHAPLEQRQVEQAWEEARTLSPKPDILLFAAFHFDPEAAKDIDELTPQKTGMIFLRSQMNTDLLTEDLKKKRASNESFWLIGQPDVELRKIKNGDHKGLWHVEVVGFDYYNPTTGKIESGDTRKIAMWLLDTDYDGRSLFPRQVFFPMAGEKEGWARLAKTLKAEIDEEKIEAYRGTVSLPFEPGEHRRVAVKIVDDRGIESLKLLNIE